MKCIDQQVSGPRVPEATASRTEIEPIFYALHQVARQFIPCLARLRWWISLLPLLSQTAEVIKLLARQ
jgi:hypothetical protein